MFVYQAMHADHASAYRKGAPDANGQAPERTISDGEGNPCRHCLDFVPKGRPMLILAYRPFQTINPYAELGPIFLCGDDCERHAGRGLPPILKSSPDYLLRGYDSSERIVYGTGGVVPVARVEHRLTELFAMPTVDFVHIRSARNNCFQLRVDKA
ncbi:MAG: DUF1203 domain-containing protein [Paracoccaceae bacterium]